MPGGFVNMDEPLEVAAARELAEETGIEEPFIEPTNHLRSDEGRPARIYRYRSDAVAEVKARRLFP